MNKKDGQKEKNTIPVIHKNKKRWFFYLSIFVLLVVTVVLGFLIINLRAAFTEQINYQGRLTDSGGAPVADDSYAFVFSLCTDSNGSTCPWTESQSVTTSKGLFSVMLGSVTPFGSLSFNQDLWLKVSVEGTPLSPLKKLGAVSAAFEASRLGGKTEDLFALLAGRLGGQTLIGGTGITDILKLQGTSGNGTLTSPSIQFMVGNNGTTTGMTILNNGNVGVGTTSPETVLDVKGTVRTGSNTGSDGYDVIFYGTYGALTGSSMFWDTSKSAFRSGRDSSTYWSDAQVGAYSFATGLDTRGTNLYSFASGYRTLASGGAATALGYYTTASNSYSLSSGYYTVASGGYSQSGGYYTTASGTTSIALGAWVTAGTAANTIVLGKGINNTTRLVNNTANSLMVGFMSDVATFFVGPGDGSSGSIGKVGIGTSTPTNILSLGNNTDQKFWIENSATDVGGKALTIASGGTIAGTSVDNVSGGNLVLQSGLGTGTGSSNILFQTGTTLGSGKTLQDYSTKMIITGDGRIGIGTENPVGKFNILSDITDYPSGSGDYGGTYLRMYHTTTTGDHHTTPLYLLNGPSVLSGVTDNGDGYRGIWINNLRNIKEGVADNGTIVNMMGGDIYYGHYNIDTEASPSTTNAYGLRIVPYIRSGSITNAYDLFLRTPSSLPAGTIQNHYGIYQDTNTAKNYFAGSVGIGITDPGAKLHIVGTETNEAIRIDRNAGMPSIKAGSTDGYMIIESSGQQLRLNNYVTDNVILANGGGKVGVGQNIIPREILHAHKATTADTYQNVLMVSTNHADAGTYKGAAIKFGRGNIGNNEEDYSARIIGRFTSGNNFSSSLLFQVHGNSSSTSYIDAMYINTSGNVGIGTTTPGARLHVSQSAVGEVARFSTGGTPNITLTTASDADTSGRIIMRDVNDDISGAIRIGIGNNSNNNRYIAFDVNTVSMTGETYTEAMRIDSAGNVGIGTTDPQSALHVPDGKYAQFQDNNAGAPPSADCDNDAERGRISIDTTNNRLYICNGATRGWDYIALTN